MDPLFLLVALGVGVALGVMIGLLRSARSQAEARMARQHLEELQQTQREREQQQADLLRTELRALASDVARRESSEIREAGTDALHRVVAPLKEDVAALQKALHEVNEKGAANKASLDEMLRQLATQTARVGQQADDLTRALKGENKTQGNWGEMILSSILQNSGLREGIEFIEQPAMTDADGRRKQPDVVVKFPDGRSVVIDSKVSLTDYMRYAGAATTAEGEQAAKAHALSVKRHIDELAGKRYDEVVEGSPGYVIMFLQSDAAYMLAMKTDSALQLHAFRQRVVVTCPTTLMLALRIVYSLWQIDKQNRNVEEVVQRASALYDKFAGFMASFDEVGEAIQRAQRACEQADSRLRSGKGSLMRRFEDLRAMGLNPKKQLPHLPDDEKNEGNL